MPATKKKNTEQESKSSKKNAPAKKEKPTRVKKEKEDTKPAQKPKSSKKASPSPSKGKKTADNSLKVKKPIDKKAKKPTKAKKSPSSADAETSNAVDKSHSAKVKVTSGTISRANINRINGYGRLVYQRVKAIVPSMELSKRGAFTISCMLDSIIGDLVDRTLDVFSMQGRKTVSAQDVLIAMRTLLPRTLSDIALNRAVDIIASRHGNEKSLNDLETAIRSAPGFEKHYKTAA